MSSSTDTVAAAELLGDEERKIRVQIRERDLVSALEITVVVTVPLTLAVRERVRLLRNTAMGKPVLEVLASLSDCGQAGFGLCTEQVRFSF